MNTKQIHENLQYAIQNISNPGVAIKCIREVIESLPKEEDEKEDCDSKEQMKLEL